MERVARPLAARFFPDQCGASLDHHVAFFDGRGAIARYQTAVDIPASFEPGGEDCYAYRLEDEAEVTLDICLRAKDVDGTVASRYLHGTDVDPLEPPLAISHHSVGTALLYRPPLAVVLERPPSPPPLRHVALLGGAERHSRAVDGPEDLHLVIWCRATKYRELYAYDGDEDYRVYGPLAHEYGEEGVPGPNGDGLAGDGDGLGDGEGVRPKSAGRIRPVLPPASEPSDDLPFTNPARRRTSSGATRARRGRRRPRAACRRRASSSTTSSTRRTRTGTASRTEEWTGLVELPGEAIDYRAGRGGGSGASGRVWDSLLTSRGTGRRRRRR